MPMKIYNIEYDNINFTPRILEPNAAKEPITNDRKQIIEGKDLLYKKIRTAQEWGNFFRENNNRGELV